MFLPRPRRWLTNACRMNAAAVCVRGHQSISLLLACTGITDRQRQTQRGKAAGDDFQSIFRRADDSEIISLLPVFVSTATVAAAVNSTSVRPLISFAALVVSRCSHDSVEWSWYEYIAHPVRLSQRKPRDAAHYCRNLLTHRMSPEYCNVALLMYALPLPVAS